MRSLRAFRVVRIFGRGVARHVHRARPQRLPHHAHRLLHLCGTHTHTSTQTQTERERERERESERETNRHNTHTGAHASADTHRHAHARAHKHTTIHAHIEPALGASLSCPSYPPSVRRTHARTHMKARTYERKHARTWTHMYARTHRHTHARTLHPFVRTIPHPRPSPTPPRRRG